MNFFLRFLDVYEIIECMSLGLVVDIYFFSEMIKITVLNGQKNLIVKKHKLQF